MDNKGSGDIGHTGKNSLKMRNNDKNNKTDSTPNKGKTFSRTY